MIDVLVVGGGPAGRALAAECAVRGQATTLVDPRPAAPWRATYGAWLDDLPAGLPAPAATADGLVIAVGTHALDRTYAVLDVPAMRAHLDARLHDGGARVVTGTVVGRSGPTVLLADGTRLTARALVDAGGQRAPLRLPRGDRPEAADRQGPRPPDDRRRPGAATHQGPAAEQTAYGVVVDSAAAAPLVGAGEALFMDWRPDHGEPGWPTFLYAIPLGGGAVLLEETSLARRPGLPLAVLRRRLSARLAHHGIALPSDRTALDTVGGARGAAATGAATAAGGAAGGRVERVRFRVDQPGHSTPGVLGFGAAAPLVHPATGFNIADALRLAPAVADALAAGGVRAAERVLWSPRAKAVHRLRRIGLEALLYMPPDAVPAFFETFFALPWHHRRAYLSGRDDLAGLLAAMGALFARADLRLRCRLVGTAFRPPAPALPKAA